MGEDPPKETSSTDCGCFVQKDFIPEGHGCLGEEVGAASPG
jgi:hypothetical protein